MRRSPAEPPRSCGRAYSAGALLAALALLGCTGSIGEEGALMGADRNGAQGQAPDGIAEPGSGGTPAGGSAGASGDGPPGAEAIDCATAPIDPGPSPLRLLTREQYLNTVRELVGEVEGLEQALGPATTASAFGLLQPDVTQVELESFQAAADRIAAAVVQDPDALAAVAPCEASAEPRDCARAMIETFGARAYRAQLDGDAEIERHLALFAAGEQTSYAHGIELLLRGMLLSPRFLYRVELGTQERVSEHAVRLSGPELAARLSYAIWDAPPDAALIAAAADGSLTTPEGVTEQLARMLEEPRGQTLMRRFLEALTHVSELDAVVKDQEMFPQWQATEFRAALSEQARRFFDQVLDAEQGRLDALLTSRTVFVQRELAGFYGVTGGDEFEPLELDTGRAAGLLTLPALLSRLAKPDESSPIYRGKFVREVLLCQQLPAPPANVPKPPEVEPDVSTRERLSQHEVDPACSNCHQLLDPIGFGFEHFDAIGRYRMEDGGEPVDARGELVATRDADGAFAGVSELGAALAGSAEVQECVARQFFRYALSRFEQDVDACSVERMLATFAAAEQDLNVLPRAVIETDAFLYRRPTDAEVMP